MRETPPESDATDVIRVAVVDDHDAIHAGVQAWCRAAEPPIRVAGCYTTADELVTDHPDAGAVDVVLLDLELHSRQPDFSAVERICAAGHRVVIYSHIEHAEVILRCLDLGANSYVAKSEARPHVIAALRAAAVGGSHIAPRMAGAIGSDNRENRPNLTTREREVLLAWFQTESKDLVAQRLSLSGSTVRTYLQRVRAKYAAAGRPAPTKAALVARAVQDGIIGIDEL
jgi:DNA-binding NarL/FixJ family response regulator